MRLSELVGIKKGKKPPVVRQVPIEGDIRLLQIGDLRHEPSVKFTALTEKSVVAVESDVVLAWDGANAGISNFGLSGVVGSTLAVLRPHRPEEVWTPYLGAFLRSQESHLRANCKGAAIPHIDPRCLADLDVDLPPLEEQQRIASILDQVDDMNVRRRRSIALLDELAESVFIEMFGELRSIGMTVADVSASTKGSIRTGPFGSQLLHSEFVDDGIAVLGIDNVVTNAFGWGERRFITPEKYETLQRYTVRPGDVLISIMGTCGRCAVVPDDIPLAINTKHLCAITVDGAKILPDFLRACFLWHPEARQHLQSEAKGAIMSGLNMGTIKSMPLPVPPLDQQHTFVERLRYVTSFQLDLESAAMEAALLEAGLRARAFSGAL